ncbi:MAG: sel1 repeat family protein [Methylococcaceae bacterium]|nr:sel1 repeat family protein [Methylococcaceae bacterium]
MFKPLKILILSFSLAFTATVQAESLEQPEIVQQAEKGEALEQAKLAAMYLLGREGFANNPVKAAEWMEKAAKQNLVEAQVAIAAMYDRGLGVKQNVKTATSWYEKAAKQGHETSLAILGRNKVAKGSVAFSYKAMRLQASKQIPKEYAKRFLRKK